mgnify:CR=1 FL=1
MSLPHRPCQSYSEKNQRMSFNEKQSHDDILKSKIDRLDKLASENEKFLSDLFNTSNSAGLQDYQLDEIYTWIDNVPLTRPKKNIARDFSDCILMAQVIHHYLPPSSKNLIEVHNYIESMSLKVKMENWKLLNKKVLSRLDALQLTDDEIQNVAESQPDAIELVLAKVKKAIETYKKLLKSDSSMVTKHPIKNEINA